MDAVASYTPFIVFAVIIAAIVAIAYFRKHPQSGQALVSTIEHDLPPSWLAALEKIGAVDHAAIVTAAMTSAGQVAAAAIAAANGAKPAPSASPAPTPAAAAASPAPVASAKPNPYNLPAVQPATVTIDRTKYPTQPGRANAVIALAQAVAAFYGNYTTKIVSENGIEVGNTGDEIVPTGPVPGETGFALVRGGPPLRNPVTKNVPLGPFAFNVPPDKASAHLEVMGAPGGGWFHNVVYSVSNAAGVVIPPATVQMASTGGPLQDAHMDDSLHLPPGDYTLTVSVDGPESGQGTLAVQYYP